MRKDVQTVKDQFNPTGEKTRKELQDEFDVLDKDSSEATYLADRQKQGNTYPEGRFQIHPEEMKVRKA